VIARVLRSRNARFYWPFGAPGRIRTSDPQIRSLVLYPAELRARASAECAHKAAHSYRVQAELARRRVPVGSARGDAVRAELSSPAFDN
jgi:hypothetical protein